MKRKRVNEENEFEKKLKVRKFPPFIFVVREKYFQSIHSREIEKGKKLKFVRSLLFNNSAEKEIKRYHFCFKKEHSFLKKSANLAFKSVNDLIENEPVGEFSEDYYLFRGCCHLDYFFEYESAIKDFTKAIELNSNNFQAYYHRSYAKDKLIREQENNLPKTKKKILLDDCLADLNKSIEINPNFPYSYAFRGAILEIDYQKYDHALLDYSKAVEFDPSNERFRYLKGSFLGDSLQNYDSAIKELSKAIEINGDFSEALRARGDMYFCLKDFEKSRKDYFVAIQKNPKNYLSYFCRGVFYKRKQFYEESLKDFATTIELNPNYSESYNERSGVYKLISNLDFALKDINRAIEIDPGKSNYHFFRGYLYDELEKYDLALENYSKSIELNPSKEKNGNSYYNRGLIYENKKNYVLAIREYFNVSDTFEDLGRCVEELKKKLFSNKFSCNCWV